jgi:type III secretion system FlhB-like substrate exporter
MTKEEAATLAKKIIDHAKKSGLPVEKKGKKNNPRTW